MHPVQMAQQSASPASVVENGRSSYVSVATRKCEAELLSMNEQRLTAWTMLISTSFEAWPVRTFFNASDVKGKWPLPVTASPKRKKGMIKLQKM